jgi:CheY-like chemotaxis protein
MWKILAADDEGTSRKVVEDALRGRAECKVFNNGRELLDTFEASLQSSEKYDAILLDVAMPDLDGLTLLRKIRKMEEKIGIQIGDGIPVIMVTAYKENFLDAFNRGCDDYLVKPVNPQTLIEKIEEKLGRAKRT